MPDLTYVVAAVRARYPAAFADVDVLCRYSDDVVRALHQVDPAFGHLQKSAGQTHCVDVGGRHARDVALYRPTGQIVDFIASAGFGAGPRPDDLDDDEPWPPANAVTWQVGPVAEYGPDKWYAPSRVGGALPPLEPPAAPDVPPPSAADPALAQRLTIAEAEIRGLHILRIEMSKQQGATNETIQRFDARLAAVEQDMTALRGRLDTLERAAPARPWWRPW